MCKGGSTTTTNNGPPQVYQDAYKNLTTAAGQVAGQPLQQYQGPMVAGFSPDQLQAFSNINASQNIGQPYNNAALGYAQQSANPFASSLPQFSSGDLSGLGQNSLNWLGQSANPVSPMQFSQGALDQYMSPYNNDVINSALAYSDQNDAAQQSALKGNAITQGAFGGDRAGVAQAQLMQNQGMNRNQMVSNLLNQNYTQGLNEFNTQQNTDLQSQIQNAQRQQQAAQLGLGAFSNAQNYALNANQADAQRAAGAATQIGNLGQQAFGQALTGAQAQLGAGNQQQQLMQQYYNVPYELFQQQQAYPFQTMGWLSNIVEGLGGSSGSSSSTTQPAPSGISQGLGAATSLASLGNSLFGSNGLFGGSSGPGIQDIGGWTGIKTGGRVGRASGGLVPGASYRREGLAAGGSSIFDTPSLQSQGVDYLNGGQGGGGGIGSYGGIDTMGGTQKFGSTTTSQKSDPLTDILNVAKTAAQVAVMFANKGGRVYADGGDVGDDPMSPVETALGLSPVLRQLTMPTSDARRKMVKHPAAHGFVRGEDDLTPISGNDYPGPDMYALSRLASSMQPDAPLTDDQFPQAAYDTGDREPMQADQVNALMSQPTGSQLAKAAVNRGLDAELAQQQEYLNLRGLEGHKNSGEQAKYLKTIMDFIEANKRMSHLGAAFKRQAPDLPGLPSDYEYVPPGGIATTPTMTADDDDSAAYRGYAQGGTPDWESALPVGGLLGFGVGSLLGKGSGSMPTKKKKVSPLDGFDVSKLMPQGIEGNPNSQLPTYSSMMSGMPAPQVGQTPSNLTSILNAQANAPHMADGGDVDNHAKMQPGSSWFEKLFNGNLQPLHREGMDDGGTPDATSMDPWSRTFDTLGDELGSLPEEMAARWRMGPGRAPSTATPSALHDPRFSNVDLGAVGDLPGVHNAPDIDSGPYGVSAPTHGGHGLHKGMPMPRPKPDVPQDQAPAPDDGQGDDKGDWWQKYSQSPDYLALRAGLNMMAGQSPYAAVNIGAGVGKAMDEYTAGKRQVAEDDARRLMQQAQMQHLKGEEKHWGAEEENVRAGIAERRDASAQAAAAHSDALKQALQIHQENMESIGNSRVAAQADFYSKQLDRLSTRRTMLGTIQDDTQRAAAEKDITKQEQMLNTKIQSLLTPNGAGAAAPSDADLQFTAQKYGMTVEQVKAKLGLQ